MSAEFRIVAACIGVSILIVLLAMWCCHLALNAGKRSAVDEFNTFVLGAERRDRISKEEDSCQH